MREDAEYNRDKTEELLSQGVRTFRIIGLIDQEGNKLSLDEARKRGILKEDENPVAEIRAFGTKIRISDMSEDRSRSHEYINDALHMVCQEIGADPQSFNRNAYLDWFTHTLGEQVAKLHKLGYVHGNLHAQNITLDCRIVDLDSLETEEELGYEEFEKRKEKDKSVARGAARYLHTIMEDFRGNTSSVFGSRYDNTMAHGNSS